jgi:hypothetical protein
MTRPPMARRAQAADAAVGPCIPLGRPAQLAVPEPAGHGLPRLRELDGPAQGRPADAGVPIRCVNMRNIYIVSIMTCARASQGPTCLLCRRAPAEKAFPGLQLERRTKLDDAIDPERRRAWRRPAQGRRNLILRSVVSSRSPRVTHSFRYGGAPYRFLYGGAPYKSPKIVENRAACGGCGSLAARAVDTYRQKSLNCQKSAACGGSPRFSRTSESHSYSHRP